jgi:hypothetical protein
VVHDAPRATTKLSPTHVLAAIRRASKQWWPAIVVGLLLVSPLIGVGAWLYFNDRWAPIYDLALTEMRVRDVGSSNTPLVGLPGRLGRVGAPMGYGSHPGPLSFYSLAPVYRLWGGSYWALRVSMASLNALAIIATLLIANRRAGMPGVLMAGAAVGLLELGYGLPRLTEPWNPHLPLLGFVVCLMGVWSVACDDLDMLPVVAFSACFCAQTHIPYLPVCGALGLVSAILAVASWVRARRRGSDQRRHVRAIGLTAILTLLLWMPPLIDQSINEPGNFRILIDYFAHPPAATVGLRSALGVLVAHLDAWHLIVHEAADPGTLGIVLHPRQPSAARGWVLVALWVVAMAAAIRLENRALMALHGVVAASLLIALVAISRIIGVAWPYLTYWAWAIGVALLLVVVSTAALAIAKRASQRWRDRGRQVAPVLGFLGVGLCCLRLLMETRTAGSVAPAASEQLGQLAPLTVSAIRTRAGGTPGDAGRYLVTWTDALYSGAQGIGLVNELERRGLRAGVDNPMYATLMSKHRVIEPHEATARLHLATGARWVSKWRKTPGAIEIAFSDPRTPEARYQHDQMRKDVIRALRQIGRKDLVRSLDWDLPGARDASGDPLVAMAIGRLVEIGEPAAVFLVPVVAR